MNDDQTEKFCVCSYNWLRPPPHGLVVELNSSTKFIIVEFEIEWDFQIVYPIPLFSFRIFLDTVYLLAGIYPKNISFMKNATKLDEPVADSKVTPK